MGRRRSPAPLLAVTFAVLLAALPHLAESSSRHHHAHGHHSRVQIRGYGEGGEGEERGGMAKAKAKAWPCCDSCGGCTKSIPPRCQCMDAAPGGCHPACESCVKSSLSVHPPVYHCMDRIANFCQRRCSPAAATAH